MEDGNAGNQNDGPEQRVAIFRMGAGFPEESAVLYCAGWKDCFGQQRGNGAGNRYP